ncbi:hypothetical protein [Hyalangium versicolor]|uniref:hypothetical protein n=1 Tax=Hyalangium versicolor TaxID=2861190 RepID=UPI001CCD2CD2|nr:hypothetical protein [Hyalangium versicolor]
MPRLQWEFTFYEQRKDTLVVLVEGGPGYSVARPDTAVEGFDVPFNSFYENTAQIGLGYRQQTLGGLHWGFQVTGGPLWYGGHLTHLPDERYTVGLIEGRLQVGRQFGSIVLGGAIGYGEPFNFKRRSVVRPFAGGFLLGVFADWR